MRCPVDGTDMFVVEYHKIELDYCPACSGVWFDSGELDLLFDTLKQSGVTISGEGLALTNQESSEAKRRCPSCARKMNKSKMANVLLDVCPVGDGLWFDGQELDCVLKQVCKVPDGTGGSAVAAFLSETFQASQEKPSQ